jgi:hypothetical protein
VSVVAPVAVRVTLRGVLIPLAALAGYLFAFGLAYAVDKFVRAIFGSLKGATGWIPFAGKVINVPIHAIERKLTHYVGEVEQACEARVSRAFHDLGTNVLHLSRDIYETAVAIGELSWYVTHKLPSVAIGRKADKAYARAVKAERLSRDALARVRDARITLDHPTKGTTGAAIKVATRPLATRIGRLERTTDARLDRLEAGIAVPVPRTVPRVGSRDLVARREIDRLRKWVREHQRVIVGAAGVGLVIRALATLKLGWLRCSNVGKLGRRACSLDPGLLESLLAESLVIVGAISIVDFAEELQGAVGFASDAVHGFIRES